ncbi:DUF3006 domain-containing protein [Alkaliphilus oremlandii]|uniref:DUF3006 domain-containing protein n=1 Tax=Alkaliphilus oremlandii (strain OhILAs) TaxID=350688 RepID=A8MF30_ALKOO|nr:DUF3006 domain-containing protein [Alkaliphilus oremlandii]ABW18699.1 conserved hypothetical protein [Alkaliphilus oremlandii OhILAs]
MSMIVLDRFEGNFAVVEIDGETVNVEINLVMDDVKEGDVLKIVEGFYYRDEEATSNRKKYMEDRFKDLWED